MPTTQELKKIQEIKNPLARQRHLKCLELPDNIRKIIFDIETVNKINDISEKNELSHSQEWKASYIVGMVLLGETNITKFVDSLMAQCDLSEEKARQLARDVNSAIFLPVKESMKKIHGIDNWPREEENSSHKKYIQENESQRTIKLEEKKPPIATNVVNLRDE